MQANNFSIAGDVLFVKGELNAQSVGGLVTAMNADNISTLDFSDVTSVSFAAVRSLMRFARTGHRFSIINTIPNVLEMIEATGLGVYVNVTLKPQELDLAKFQVFSDGILSKAYGSVDGDAMLKVYDKRVPGWAIAQERTVARCVSVLGVNTPLPGVLYKVGDSVAVTYERIEGKRSVSRIICEEPQRIEEMARLFANMCKELHATECDTKIFRNHSTRLIKAVNASPFLSEEAKRKAVDFVNNVPMTNTCLHGQMELSNVIISPDGEKMWIDVAEFDYGNPLFDLGMMYFQSHHNSDELLQVIFHMDKAQMLKVWDVFAREYFGLDASKSLDEVNTMLEPYAALTMILLGSSYGLEPHIVKFIQDVFK